MNFNSLLLELFERKKDLNRSYSIRAFARDLNLSPSFVSRALRGEKSFSLKQLKLIFKILDIEKETQLKLKSLFIIDKLGPEFKNLAQTKSPKSHLNFKNLSQNKLSLLTRWYYIPVLELLTVSGSDITVPKMARRLGISYAMVQESIDALEKLNVLSKENGKYIRRTNLVRFASATSKPEIRQYHASMIEKAAEELKKTDGDAFNLRLITGITFGANLEALETAKGILNDAIHKAATILSEASDGGEVYQINLQLFPLTKALNQD